MTDFTSLRRMGLLSAFAAAVAAGLLLLSTVIAQAQSYQIRPGDVLRIEVLEDATLNRTVLVAPDGRISLPSAGTLRAAGRTIEAVQNLLVTRLEPNFANTPNVFVAIEALRPEREPRPPAPPATISVFVIGEVNSPGGLTVEEGTDVLQMFAVMGGFTNFAAEKRVQLRRKTANGGEQIIPLNYKAIEAGAARGRMVLQDGDVIIVPQRRLFE